MKIRMKVSITGTRCDGGRWPQAGEELVVSDVEGADLCAQGYAVPVAEPAKVKAEKRTTKKK